MKRLHTSSREEKGVTEMSLSRIISLFAWYLYAEFLRVGGRIASSVAELLRSDMSVRVLSQQLWTKKTMTWGISTGDQTSFQVKQAKTTCPFELQSSNLCCCFQLCQGNEFCGGKCLLNLSESLHAISRNTDIWKTFHDLLIACELTPR